jgi:hypothetical protein
MKSQRWQCQNTTTPQQQFQMRRWEWGQLECMQKCWKFQRKLRHNKQQEKKMKKHELQVIKG